MKKKYFIPIVVFCALIYSCRKDRGTLATSNASSCDTVNSAIIVSVVDYNFVPASVNCNVGDTIKWVWDPANASPHSSTSTAVPTGAATWDSDAQNAPFTYSYVITKSGTYNYICMFHPAMTGTITVCQ